MRHRVILVLLVGLGLAPAARALEPDKKPAPGPSLEQLVDQLGSKDFRVREKASKAILALGKESLPALHKGRSHADAEVRRRLDELIPPLERALTLTPHSVTLHVTNKPLQEVVNQLTKQTGFKIMFAQNGPANPAQDKKLYTFHFDKVPFWQVFDQLSEQCGVVIQNSGDDSLHLNAQDSYIPFSCTSGPFKVIATGFSYNRNSNFGQVSRTPYQPGQQTYEWMSLGLTIASEPRLPILKLGPVKLICAEDDENHSMAAANTDGYSFGPWGMMMWRSNYGWWNRSVVQQTQANLNWPSKACRTVKTLKGIIPVTVLADQKPLVVTDKLLTSKGKKFTVGPATFTIDDVTKLAGGKQYQIKMSVTEDTKDGSEDWSRMQSLQQRLGVEDDKGKKHQFNCHVTNWGGPTSAQFMLMIQPSNDAKLGPPNKLIYYSWILMEHEVEFEFKGLPLP